ncbi:hypothetical protein ES703_68238 [subsurface metagenome]
MTSILEMVSQLSNDTFEGTSRKFLFYLCCTSMKLTALIFIHE